MSMTPLSRRGRISLERRFAAAALAHYGLEHATYRLLTLSHAARFRVRAAERSMLRLNNPDWHPAPGIASELEWLAYLRQRTPLIVPQPQPARDGRSVLEIALPGVPERRVATLFRWIPARRLPAPLTQRDSERIGLALAQLHAAAMAFVPPAGFARPHLHSEIFAQAAQHVARAESPLLGAREKRVCLAAFERVMAHVGRLGRAPQHYGLIHADTNLSNFLVCGRQVALIDFEVCGFGYYLYDVARTLNELATAAASAERIAGFYAGYRRIVPALPAWTDAGLRLFRLMNYLEIVRWVITTPPRYRQPEMAGALRQALAMIERLGAA